MRGIVRSSVFALLRSKISSSYSVLTCFLTKPSWPLSPSSFQHRFLCRYPPLCLIDHLVQYLFRHLLASCLVSQSAIGYRASIHLKSASPSVALDLTLASSIASRLSVDEGAAPSLSTASYRRQQPIINNAGFQKPPRSRSKKLLPSSCGSTMFSSSPAVPCTLRYCLSEQPNFCAPLS